MASFTFYVVGASRSVAANVVELPSPANAVVEAIRYTGRVLDSAPDLLLLDENWTVEVADRVGHVLLSIFVSAVRSPSVQTN